MYEGLPRIISKNLVFLKEPNTIGLVSENNVYIKHYCIAGWKPKHFLAILFGHIFLFFYDMTLLCYTNLQQQNM